MSTPKQPCRHCLARLPPAAMLKHLFTCEANRPFPCDLCGRRFPNQTGVSTHKSKYHTAAERGTRYTCKYCTHGSDDLTSILKHQKHHKEEGGPGFNARSRSRSQGAPQNNGRNRSRSRSQVTTTRYEETETINIRTNNTRANSRARSTATNNNTRDHSRARSTISWANKQPTTEDIAKASQNEHQRSNGGEEPVENPLFAELNGHNTGPSVIRLTMVDPEKAIPIMDERDERLRDIMMRQRWQNATIRQLCREKGIRINDHDFVEDRIRKFEELFGPLPPYEDND